MEHFSYSLFLSLLHSLWQGAVLLCLYMGAGIFMGRSNPAHKRNVLFFLLAAQLITTITTFFMYYTGSGIFYSSYIVSGFSELFIRRPYMEIGAPWMIGAYLFALMFKTTRLFVNWHRFRINVRSSWIKPSVNFKLFTAIKANEFGIQRKVKLWYSNAISTPLTYGFLKPVILLPVALINNLSVEETETLIIHELTHIKNNDYFLNWILIACETLFFFNPFIQAIAGKIKLEREKNCDTQVLQFNYPALDYAETLLKTAKFKTAPTPFFLAAVFKNTQLIKRIRFFTEEKNLDFYKRNYSTISLLPVAAILVLNIFLINFINNRKVEVPTISEAAIVGVNNENIPAHFSTSPLPANDTEYKVPTVSRIPTQPLNELNAQIAKLAEEKEALEANLNEMDPVGIEIPVNIPVAVVQADDNSKEIVLSEENSVTGRSVTKVYKMTFENGEWKTKLMWTITEKRAGSDSLLRVIDSVNNRLYDQQSQ